MSKQFDHRYFNSLSLNKTTVTKTSQDKTKLKAEFNYYQLSPDIIKPYLVQPHNYTETDLLASYTMDYIPIPDLGFRLTHNQINSEELTEILSALYTFISKCPQKPISESARKKLSDNLYLNKVHSRVNKLKLTSEYPQITTRISALTPYSSIDEIIEYYDSLYQQITNTHQFPNMAVVSHGDLCFSNIFYNSSTHELKLIDPKGALSESDLYLDTYYDIAKLSHSICGSYDFFNAGLYNLDNNGKLTINRDNTFTIDIFKSFLRDHQYDYALTRLCEASLFLSMLPLHIDNPHKVVAFIVNALDILQEVENG